MLYMKCLIDIAQIGVGIVNGFAIVVRFRTEEIHQDELDGPKGRRTQKQYFQPRLVVMGPVIIETRLEMAPSAQVRREIRKPRS